MLILEASLFILSILLNFSFLSENYYLTSFTLIRNRKCILPASERGHVIFEYFFQYVSLQCRLRRDDSRCSFYWIKQRIWILSYRFLQSFTAQRHVGTQPQISTNRRFDSHIL